MKTCATCERLEKRWCMEVASAIRYPDKQSCTEHSEKVEKKKEPLRLECECVWEKAVTINSDIAVFAPVFKEYYYPGFYKFENKRTRMTLEEIL